MAGRDIITLLTRNLRGPLRRASGVSIALSDICENSWMDIVNASKKKKKMVEWVSYVFKSSLVGEKDLLQTMDG